MSESKQKRHRSPNFPSISLKRAIELVGLFYIDNKSAATHAEAAIQSWEMSPKSSTGKRTLGAIISYGLLDDEGKGNERKVRISSLGLTALHAKPDTNPERISALQTAALNPKIHTVLFKEYDGEIPSDHALTLFLVQHGFSDDAAKDLIAEWRETFSYAMLDTNTNDQKSIENGLVDERDEAMSRQHHHVNTVESNPVSTALANQAIPATTPTTRRLVIPISGGKVVTIEAPTIFSQADLDMFVTMIEAMGAGLVNEPDQDQD